MTLDDRSQGITDISHFVIAVGGFFIWEPVGLAELVIKNIGGECKQIRIGEAGLNIAEESVD